MRVRVRVRGVRVRVRGVRVRSIWVRVENALFLGERVTELNRDLNL